MATARRSIAAISAVAVLGAVDGTQAYAASLLTPEIAATLEVAVTSVLAARLLGLALGAVLPLLMPAIAATRRIRIRIWACRISGLLGAAAVALIGSVTNTGALVAMLCVVAALSAPSQALHRRMALDEASTDAPVRALTALQVAVLTGQLAVAVVAATGIVTTWPAVMVTAGGLAVVAGLVASAVLRPSSGSEPAGGSPAAPELPWKEVARAWRSTRSIAGIAVAALAIGVLLVPYDAVLAIYLHSRWQLRLSGTSTVFAALAAMSLIVVVLNARRADRQLVRSPRRLATEVWCALLLGSVLLGVGACLPSRAMLVVLVSAGAALIAALLPPLAALAFSVVPQSQRAAMSAALAGALSAGAGLGIMYATAFENRHGARSALVAMAALGVVAAGFWRVRSTAIESDQQRVRDAMVEQQSREARRATGARPPLLDCHGIDFSYGALQVLFDVSFTIDDGEVVALLGTNGAGKSTLLKVISGIGFPQRGAVHFAGRDITYLDAEDRVTVGITQVPGGRAVFGDLTVIENLQSFGYQLGRDRRRRHEAIERCIEAFPQLAERRTATAATLSGGEQQMVGLCKALILRPRLLLIDELSLGLAPMVVGPLLDLVRRINADGTAVVIVEQSVNVALSLVDHAYFMEKGTIRFDGRATDLLDRDDLLRAVFLEGAAKGTLA